MNTALWQGRFRDYMEVLSWSPRTVTGYLAEIKHFMAFLETLNIHQLSNVSRDHVEAYQAHLFELRHRGRPLTPSTRCSRLNAVKAFLRFLVRQNYILVNPASEVE